MSILHFYVYAVALGPGLIIGIATLPWNNNINRSHFSWVSIWVFTWPFMILFFAWEGIKIYKEAWGDYLSWRRHAHDNKK